MSKKFVRKRPVQKHGKARTWSPKQLSKQEFERRHAEHVERQRKMGLSDAEIELSLEGRGELARGRRGESAP